MAIVITYEDMEYKLDYSRNTIEQMERKGFVMDELLQKPVTMLPKLFEGAFLLHHKNLVQSNPNKIREIYNHLEVKDNLTSDNEDEEATGIVAELIKMYQKSLTEIIQGGKDATDSKKAKWEVIE